MEQELVQVHSMVPEQALDSKGQVLAQVHSMVRELVLGSKVLEPVRVHSKLELVLALGSMVLEQGLGSKLS